MNRRQADQFAEQFEALDDEMRAILLKAERAGRDLFPEESARFDDLKSQQRALSLRTRSGMEAALRRDVGLSRAAARKLLDHGWSGLASHEDEERAAASRLSSGLRAATEKLLSLTTKDHLS